MIRSRNVRNFATVIEGLIRVNKIVEFSCLPSKRTPIQVPAFEAMNDSTVEVMIFFPPSAEYRFFDAGHDHRECIQKCLCIYLNFGHKSSRSDIIRDI